MPLESPEPFGWGPRGQHNIDPYGFRAKPLAREGAMGRRGPLPDSERLRALKGRRPGGRELTPRPVVPPEPEWGGVFPLPKDAALAADARVMRREARACWRLLVVELERSGAIAILDADILWRYSIARGRVVGAYRLLGREGLVVDGGRDGQRSHPAQRVIADCTRV